MQFNLSYSEVGKLIEDKTGKELPMTYGGPHTLRISYKVPLMGDVGLDINVDRIEGSDIFLSYGGGAGIEFMVRTALGQVKKQPGAELLDILDGNRLMLALGKSQQLAPIFDRIILKDIHFDESSIKIDFIPKP
ncbi:MAG: hypothetical protein IKN11_01140 [Bacteroidales bacterium]|nr:hypothetical protein [Bacteroidales bacterium]